jgi:isopenicillin-N N-acyltransferase like protein
MRVSTIAGPGLHRGLELGRERSNEIVSAATELKTHLASTGHSPGPVGRRLATSGLARTAADLTPDLWAEVTALAAGSRASLEDVLLLTFLDEVWALTRPAGCSVVARVIEGRPGAPPTPATTEIGQTMDLPSWTSGRLVVLRVATPGAPTSLVMTYPGSLGLCGSNEAGLGVAVNALWGVPFVEDGLGVAFIVRHLLTLTSLAEAAAFLTSVPHAAGQAYTIAARDGIATFEADATGVHRIDASGTPALIHTNHGLGADAGPSAPPPSESSRARLEVLMRAVEQHQPLADTLTGDLVLDGTRWNDAHLTFASFRAVGSEQSARFIDGADVRAGRHEWTRLTYR